MVADTGKGVEPIYETSTTVQPAKHHVHTTLRYYDGMPGVIPEPSIIGGPNARNQPKVESPVIVNDVTGDEDKYKLETHGFQFVKHKSKFEKDLADLKGRYKVEDDPGEVASGYYVEAAELLKEVLSSNPTYPKPSSVHIMTHLMRAGPKDGEASQGTMGPLYGVHVDQSAWSADGTARRWLGEEAEELLKKPRFQIINLWRACKPVTRDPFGVTDATSIPDENIIRVPLIFPDHTAEANEVIPSRDPAKPHLWYYKYNQQPDDVLLFIQVDSSKQPNLPKRCPHAAFKDPNLDESQGEPRVSIELRAMVFYDQDEV